MYHIKNRINHMNYKSIEGENNEEAEQRTLKLFLLDYKYVL